MRQTIRLFLLLEGASFVLAGLVRSGMLVGGYEHREASIAESVIGVVLLVGLALTWAPPTWTRTIGVAAQASRCWARWSARSRSRSASVRGRCPTSSTTPRSWPPSQGAWSSPRAPADGLGTSA
jgi:hypothetical protein